MMFEIGLILGFLITFLPAICFIRMLKHDVEIYKNYCEDKTRDNKIYIKGENK